MLSQIRQISDGNSNTVFVKNKEQKFNLDKEIHDLECWKQSRNHVYRKEERELLAHLEKLRHQQEYLHHLDEERGPHHRAVSASHRGHREKESEQSSQNNITVLPLHKDNPELSLKLNLQNELPNQAQPLGNTNVASLPPVQGSTDKKTLHRTDAHTNICVVCQLPRRSFTKHGHHYSSEEVCCCDHQQVEPKNIDRRTTVGGYEEKSHAPIQVGQRRHSLMMARLNDEKYEFTPHPPDHSKKSHSRRSQEKMDSAKRNYKDDEHTHHHTGHVHDHHSNKHEHHGHAHDHHRNKPDNHVHEHHGHMHDQHGHVHDHHGHVIDNHGHVLDSHGHMRHHHGDIHDHYGHAHDHHRNKHDNHVYDHHGHVHDHHGHMIDNHGHLRHHNGTMLDHHGYEHDHHRHKDDHHGLYGHHGNAHHYGNDTRTSDYSAFGHSNGNTHHRHSHYGNQTTDVTHTLCNSPHKSSRHSISHHNGHDPLYSAPIGHQYHSKRTSDAASHSPGNLGTGVQDSGYDARRRDHELHWDRHQVCKLRGMITDPHYKEQLDVDNKNTYPWSSQHHEANKASSVDIEDLKNCRYLRFSKLNLENMKENPEEEVDVFEKKYSPA